MKISKTEKQSSAERLATALRGAFSGPPTPLKDIPKKSGESRKAASQKTKKTEKRKSRSG